MFRERAFPLCVEPNGCRVCLGIVAAVVSRIWCPTSSPKCNTGPSPEQGGGPSGGGGPVLKDFPARGPDSTRNTAAVPSDRSVTGPPQRPACGRWRARPGEGGGFRGGAFRIPRPAPPPARGREGLPSRPPRPADHRNVWDGDRQRAPRPDPGRGRRGHGMALEGAAPLPAHDGKGRGPRSLRSTCPARTRAG